jgi:nitrite reductase/ring-hydroxylating ferredoxin subunit
MEMDFQPNRFMDDSGRFIICATHGAFYDPDSGICKGGPGRGGLIPIALTEHDGVIHWHTSYNLKPVLF